MTVWALPDRVTRWVGRTALVSRGHDKTCTFQAERRKHMITVKCLANRSYSFDPARTALVIVDCQRDFVASDGTIARCGIDVSALQACLPRIKTVLDTMRGLGAVITHCRYGFRTDLSNLPQSLREYSRAAGAEYGQPGSLGRFMTQGEPGYEIVDELRPRPGEIVVDKNTFDAFHSTDIDEQLKARSVSHVMVCGVTTQCCVEGTLRGAVDHGYYALTIEDCCGAFEPDLQQGTIRNIQSEEHLWGWICSSADLLAAIPKAAE